MDIKQGKAMDPRQSVTEKDAAAARATEKQGPPPRDPNAGIHRGLGRGFKTGPIVR